MEMKERKAKDIHINDALKSGVWYTVSNFAMKGIGFLTTPIFTRMMTKTEYGEFDNFQIWLLLLMYCTSLNLDASMIRALKDFREDKDSYMVSMISLYTLFTSVCWCISFCFRGVFGAVFSMDRVLIDCMFLYLLIFPAVQLFQTRERFEFRYKRNIAIGMIVSVGSSLLSVVLILIMQNRLMARVIGFILPSILVGAIIIIWCARKGHIKVKYWKYALPISLPVVPHLISLYLLNSMDRIMIRDFYGKEQMAMYALAYTCGMVITILFNSANDAFAPWLAEKMHNEDYDSVRKVSIQYVMLFSFFAFMIVLVTPEILMVMGGDNYLEARYVMPPVTAGCLMQFVYTLYVNVETYEKKTVGMAIASVLTAILNYVLNYIFIPRFGYVAAAYTTFVCYTVLLLFHMGLVKKIGMDKLYQNKKNCLFAGLFSVLIIMTSTIMDYALIRWSIEGICIVLVLMTLLKKRGQFNSVFQRGTKKQDPGN